MKSVTIYTDGSCLGNPGPGGWAAVLLYGEAGTELCGTAEHTTNNRMELQAAIEGLKALKEPCQVTIVTDSTYLNGTIQKAISNTLPAVNRDLWYELFKAVQVHDVTVEWVRGHAKNKYNEQADALARDCAEYMKRQIDGNEA